MRNLGSIVAGISSYHHGLNAVRERMEYDNYSNSKPRGFFTNMSDEQLFTYFRERHTGETPSYVSKHDNRSYTIAYGRDLVDVLVEKDILIRKHRKNNHFSSLNNRQFIQYVKRNFSGKCLSEIRNLDSTLEKEIRRRDLNKKVEYLGLKEGKVRDGYWMKWENIESILEEITQSLGHFPTAQELKEMDKSSVGFAIQKYHGGFIKVKERLNQEQIKRPHKYWMDWQNAEKELKKLIKDLGRFPTQQQINGGGYSSLGMAISKYHGGIDKVRQQMGYNATSFSNNKPRGYWDKIENVFNEFESIYHQLGYIPRTPVLKRLKRRNIINAIRKHGGFRIFIPLFQRQFGLATNNDCLENILDQYIGGEDGE